MKDWWQDRTQRERQILSFGGLALIILLIYFIIWLPLSDYTQTLQASTEDNQALLTWMQSADHAIQGQHNQNSPSHTTSQSARLEVIQNDLSQTHFRKNVTQLAQTDQNNVNIQIEKANFDDLMAWLVTLWQQNGIKVDELNIKRLDNQGLVSANLTLGG